MQQTDVAIIGGGIVGLATAYRLQQQRPDVRVTILEKERSVGHHQTGHNSGVLHSGIYYKPGSLRAQFCREGKQALQEFCEREGIPFELCGKVIVAVEAEELPQLERIFDRGRANGVNCELIGPERLHEIEPYARGVRAISVPDAGIVDYRQVCDKLAECVASQRGEILLSNEVRRLVRRSNRMIVETSEGDLECKLVVNCAGLQSDRVTWMSGQHPDAQIVPFRGEYYELKPSAHHLCRGLIYPVPDPNFPFLGVHFTRMVHGGVECGPNAVFSFAREGYYKTSINPFDLVESLSYPGFWRLVLRHWRAGTEEMWRSFSKRAFVAALQRLIPDVKSEDLIPAPAGVRAQALTRRGELVDDFLILEGEMVVNVCNAPSPAATASLKIGETVATRAVARLQ